MDLDTFLTILYVNVATWCKQPLADKIVKQAGATAGLTDSKVLTKALAGQLARLAAKLSAYIIGLLATRH